MIDNKKVSLLRGLVEKAIGIISKQSVRIDDLKAPPFIYATVVKIYENGNSKDSNPIDQLRKELIELTGPEMKTDPDFEKSYPNIYRLGSAGLPSSLKSAETPAVKNNPKKSAAIAVNGKLVEVAVPDDMKIQSGDTVRVHSRTLQIVEVLQAELGGEIFSVKRVHNENFIEISGGASRVVFSGRFSGQLKNGDRVVLDSTLNVVVMNLGKEEGQFHLEADANISWDDIGGLEETKKALIDIIETPYRYPKLYAFYTKKPSKGVLLFGPPGCGKTLLMKAIVTSMKKTHGGKGHSTALISIKGPEILERFVGAAEETIRQLFRLAKKHKEEHGYPAVIFIDESEAILPKRGSGVSSDVEKTIVPAFLTEMNGMEDSGAIVILATNRPDMLDPAVIRDERIDKKVRVGRPDKASALSIFGKHLKKIPVSKDTTREKLAELATEELFSEKRMIYEIGMADGGSMKFTFANLASGALIAGIINEAKMIAINRDMQKNESDYTGLTGEDIVKAVNEKYKEGFDLNHADELKEFTVDVSEKVRAVRKLKLCS